MDGQAGAEYNFKKFMFYTKKQFTLGNVIISDTYLR